MTLSGMVRSAQEKAKALQLARDTAGVTSVVDLAERERFTLNAARWFANSSKPDVRRRRARRCTGCCRHGRAPRARRRASVAYVPDRIRRVLPRAGSGAPPGRGMYASDWISSFDFGRYTISNPSLCG